MKYFLTFLVILTYTINTYSQRICDYGEYDFVLNTINGVDKTEFSVVKVLDKDKLTNIYKYDSLARLIEAKFYEERIETSCDGINNSYYVYPDIRKPNKIKITDDNGTHDAILTYYANGNLKQIKYDDFLIVDYEYNLKNQIKCITKDHKLYSYFWNEDNKIERIEIAFLNNDRKQEIKFLYKNKKLEEVSHTQLRRGYLQINRLYKYKYENNRICEVKYENKRSNDVFYSDYNYNDNDKLIITIKDSNKEYKYHYECYY